MEQVETKNQKQTFVTIFLILVLALSFLPFLSAFNDLLTRLVISLDYYKVIEDFIVPWEIRMVGVLLYPLGLKPIVAGDYLAIGGVSSPMLIEIAWNCIGWQSLLFFVITCWIGFQGERYTLLSKLKAWLIGFLGTFLINLLRISLVVLVALFFGQKVAIIIHDYGSLLVIIGWLFFFWYFTYAFILEKKI